eukprot:scaffold125218_cov29-Tisochrysis_lutea.AAC.3
MRGGAVHWRHAVLLALVGVGACTDERLDHAYVALPRREVERHSRRAVRVGRPRVDGRTCGEKCAHDGLVATPRGGVECSITVGARQVGRGARA